MMTVMSWGVATSIFPDRFDDPSITLLWAQENRFDTVQIYLNRALLGDLAKLERLSEVIRQTGRKVLFHLPDPDVYDDSARESDLNTIQAYFNRTTPVFKTHALVWHLRPDRSIKSARRISDHLIDRGFVSCPETVLESHSADSAVKATQLSQRIWNRPGTVPVLDVSRLFTIRNDHLAACLAMRWVRIAGSACEHCIFHVIDALNDPTDRNNWCQPQLGIIPWLALFQRAHNSFKSILSVFEYETAVDTIESRRWFEQNIVIPLVRE